uniref:Retrotransposon, putative, centromere-specific n=1 Tax=Oryza sativa subsp. japonica TaxID=39947 RepID=Q2QXT6_ORYSJ|nr:retrotransposon, putative, centromere-specific [Oryza sativa Japonica Group]
MGKNIWTTLKFTQVCIIYSGLKECNENTMRRFFNGLNFEVQGVQNNQQKEETNVLDKKAEKYEAPTMFEKSLQGKLNGAEINEGGYSQDELHMSTLHAMVEQLLVEPIVDILLSQVDLFDVPCDKKELCDNASLISMPQLVNNRAISSKGSDKIAQCCYFVPLKKYHVNALFMKKGSEMSCKRIISIHFYGQDHALRDEHHMKKPMTFFHEEEEDDVTMTTIDTIIAHIVNQQEDITIKSTKCWNPIRPLARVLISNSRQE